MCKKGDCWSTRYTKEERDKAREGFKRCVHQYLMDNDIDDNFNKDIIAMVLTPTIVSTTTSGNFFYNDYGVKHFMTLNRLILIKTAKNIVMFINNNAFAHGLTGSTEPGGTEPSIARYGDREFAVNTNSDESANIENLTVDIDLLDCYFNNNR